MESRIQVSMPLSFSSDEENSLKRFSKYHFEHPKVRYIEDAFITSCGLVCTSDGLLKECCHNAWSGQYDSCLHQASEYYHTARDNSDNLITFDDDEIYLVAHHPWFRNYYHWINETISRLWMVAEHSASMILLLPPESELPSFALAALKPFRFKAIFHIPAKKSVLARTVCMPELKPKMASYDRMALFSMNKLFTNYLRLNTSVEINLGQRIYVSRRKFNRRWIVNEDEVYNTPPFRDQKSVKLS